MPRSCWPTPSWPWAGTRRWPPASLPAASVSCPPRRGARTGSGITDDASGAMTMASLLKRFGVEPRTIRVKPKSEPNSTAKGYVLADLAAAAGRAGLGSYGEPRRNPVTPTAGEDGESRIPRIRQPPGISQAKGDKPMAVDTGPYIRRARKLTRRKSGEDFVRFSASCPSHPQRRNEQDKDEVQQGAGGHDGVGHQPKGC